jgi:hypothetical protein
MPSQGWSALLNPMQAANLPAAVAYASSAALTDVSPGAASNGSLVLPGNYWTVGKSIRVSARGTFANTGTPTLLLGVYLGGVAGTALATTGAVTTTTAAATWPWRVDVELTCRSVGTAGTIVAAGVAHIGTALNLLGPALAIPATAIAAVTVDTTTAKALTLGAQWGTANAANTMIVMQYLIEDLS